MGIRRNVSCSSSQRPCVSTGYTENWAFRAPDDGDRQTMGLLCTILAFFLGHPCYVLCTAV
jgi:hypothetical protein